MRFSFISCLNIQHRDTAVGFGQDHFPDLLVLGRDDDHLQGLFAGDHGLVNDKGHDNDHQNAAQDTVQALDHDLHQHHDGVEEHDALTYGNTEQLEKNAGRDVHAAGGAAGAHHNADAQAAQHTGSQSRQHDILVEHGTDGQGFKNTQDQGINNGGHQAGSCEFPAQECPAQPEKENIDDRGNDRKPHTGNELLNKQRNAVGTSQHNTVGNHKGTNSKGQ